MDNSQAACVPRVFVVDDDAPLRASLSELLATSQFEVEAFDSAEQFLEAPARHDVGCLIADERMPGMSGLELLDRLKAQDSALMSIVVTGYADTLLVVQAMRAGAVTVLDKPCPEAALLDAVRRCCELSCAQRERRARCRLIRRRVASLSASERQVLELVIQGASNKSIARQLDVSVRTVENRRRNIFQRMHAGSVAHLVRMMLAISPPEPLRED